MMHSFSPKLTINLLNRAARLYHTNPSLRTWGQPIFHIYRKLVGKVPPITGAIGVTYRCQCRCAHCYADVNGRSSNAEMSTNQIMEAIKQLKALGTLQVIFTGGEPLLREDLFDLIAHAHKVGLLTRISTNGYLLTRKCVAELKRAGLNQCGVAIDDAGWTILYGCIWPLMFITSSVTFARS